MSDLQTVEAPEPDTDDAVRRLIARCGCIGEYAYEYRRPPVVAIVVRVPCPTGHPTRVRPGVIERFLPGLLSPYQPTI